MIGVNVEREQSQGIHMALYSIASDGKLINYS